MTTDARTQSPVFAVLVVECYHEDRAIEFYTAALPRIRECRLSLGLEDARFVLSETGVTFHRV
jgi:hypothetical protein